MKPTLLHIEFETKTQSLFWAILNSQNENWIPEIGFYLTGVFWKPLWCSYQWFFKIFSVKRQPHITETYWASIYDRLRVQFFKRVFSKTRPNYNFYMLVGFDLKPSKQNIINLYWYVFILPHWCGHPTKKTEMKNIISMKSCERLNRLCRKSPWTMFFVFCRFCWKWCPLFWF